MAGFSLLHFTTFEIRRNIFWESSATWEGLDNVQKLLDFFKEIWPFMDMKITNTFDSETIGMLTPVC